MAYYLNYFCLLVHFLLFSECGWLRILLFLSCCTAHDHFSHACLSWHLSSLHDTVRLTIFRLLSSWFQDRKCNVFVCFFVSVSVPSPRIQVKVNKILTFEVLILLWCRRVTGDTEEGISFVLVTLQHYKRMQSKCRKWDYCVNHFFF